MVHQVKVQSNNQKEFQTTYWVRDMELPAFLYWIAVEVNPVYMELNWIPEDNDSQLIIIDSYVYEETGKLWNQRGNYLED